MTDTQIPPAPPATREDAIARKAKLFNDSGWVNRINSGDAEAKAEWKQLNKMIDGDATS